MRDNIQLEILLEETRQRIQEYAGDDPDEWFYANRYIFARLGLDERKTKTKIKQELFNREESCDYCGKQFVAKKGIHLHRVDGDRAYSSGNCVLMHPECHRRYHQEYPKIAVRTSKRKGGSVVADYKSKRSKRYSDKAFLYWWDIPPAFMENPKGFEGVEFVKGDTGERCNVALSTLKLLLTEERRTSRSLGNWGIRILKDTPNKLSFEPPSGSDDWVTINVIWKK